MTVGLTAYRLAEMTVGLTANRPVEMTTSQKLISIGITLY